MSDEDFDRYWRDVHGQIGARIPGLRRLVLLDPSSTRYFVTEGRTLFQFQA